MWVTQTYLGAVEPDATVFIYYFYEDYNDDQKYFTKQVQHSLEDLGEVFRDRVSLLMPNPRYAGRIESEVRENIELWQSLRGKLPGLFISTVPLVQVGEKDGDSVFVSFDTQDYKGVAEAIQKVRRIAGDYISYDHERRQAQPNSSSVFRRIFDAIELKPGFAGIKIDLKRLSRRG